MKFNIKPSSTYLPLILAIVLITGMLIGVKISSGTGGRSMFVYPKMDKLSGVIEFIEMEYVDSVSRDELTEKTIPVILKNLDPHSVYIPAQDLQRVSEPLEGQFDGIGIQFNMLNDTVVVIQTISGGPSEKVGLRAGDRLISVNDTIIAGVGFDDQEIVKMLRGRRGTKVKVAVKRQEITGLIDFDITRDRIPLYSVDVGYMIDDEIGYIKISQFSRTTFTEYIDVATKLHMLGMKKLILDLRGNGGGYLDAATNIADQFLQAGELIVYTEGRSIPRNNVYATSKGINLDTEVVVIIDEWSASASEILAGAIQDNDRGVVVGRRSFGKGLVQSQTMFTDGSALRLTVARYFTPTGRSIQKPYDESDEDYFRDLDLRYLNREFDNADSIKFDESMRFTTPGGNIVYGGGGIMPDLFVPRDTIGVSVLYNQVTRMGLVYMFGFNYSDENRVALSEFDNVAELEKYLSNQNLLQKFTGFIRSEGVTVNQNDLEMSGQIFYTQIKAQIARNIFNNEGFYPVISSIDNTLQKSILILKRDSAYRFTQLK